MYILHSAMLGIENDVLIGIQTRAGVLEGLVLSALPVFAPEITIFLMLSEVVTGEPIVAEGVAVMEEMHSAGIRSVKEWFNEDSLPQTLYLPMYSYTPEEIFKGRIQAFDVNFFQDKEIKTWTAGEFLGIPIKIQYYEDENGKELFKDENGNIVKGYRVTANDEAREGIVSTVSQWYRTIRNICLVAMLSVLVYVGIRILLSSVASDKAKYKQMLMDWLIGLCLLFVMHYIMAFSVSLVENITNMIDSTTEIMQRQIEQSGLSKYVKTDSPTHMVWPTDLMGYLRVNLQMQTPGMRYVGEVICFLILVIFTVVFTFTYFKRFVYMAFLTVISPLVALTYCIDKANDGKAQGFNTWLKEYIFNLLIQPLHLLLYYILVTAAFSTMGKNVVYSIVALAFMIPAEKLLRNLFGFEKAKTPGFLGGATASAIMMGGINKLTGIAGRNKKKHIGTGQDDNENSSEDNSKIHSVNQPKEMEEKEEEPLKDETDEYDDSIYDPRFDFNQERINQERIRQIWVEQQEPTEEPFGQEEQTIQEPIDEYEGEQSNYIPREITFRGNSIIRNIIRKGRAATVAGKVAGKRILKSTPRTIKGVLTGIAVGGAATIAGTAVAASSGDAGKVATAVTAGIGGGYMAGKAATNSTIKDKINPEVTKAYQEAYQKAEKKETKVDEVKKKDRTTSKRKKPTNTKVKEERRTQTKSKNKNTKRVKREATINKKIKTQNKSSSATFKEKYKVTKNKKSELDNESSKIRMYRDNNKEN